MQGTAFYLGGATYPGDCHIEDVLAGEAELRGWRFVRHSEICAAAGEAVSGLPIETMVHILNRAVPEASEARPVALIGRSAGARAATLFAARRRVTAVACLSFPFKNPGQVLDLGRFAHLAALEAPTLIVQGTEDEYGGLNVTEDYLLSSAISLHFIAGRHGIDLTAPACAHVSDLVFDFIDGGWRNPGPLGMRFDEAYYLGLHADVAQAVAAGVWTSGEQHYASAGRRELRRYRLIADGEAGR